MEQFNDIYKEMLDNTSISFKRYLLKKINWESRLIAITGARGTGKTSLMLQKIKLDKLVQKSLYVSVDNIYFTNNSIFDMAGTFYKYGGRYLYLDEVHKYKGWSQEIKNMYDSYPDLKIVFSGSSILDIYKGFGDLSRRVVPYTLNGMSFREYLVFETGKHYKKLGLKDILSHQVDYHIESPLAFFRNYLKEGYYPFYKEKDYTIRLNGVINAVLETDIPKYLELKVSTIEKLKQLLQIISESVPFKPNFSKIAEIIGVSRNMMHEYFSYLERAGLIMQLHDKTKGVRALGKVNKVYLNNPNLVYNLSETSSNIGNIRETFMLNQLRMIGNVFAAEKGDFTIDDMVFEVGGKGKTDRQIKEAGKGFVVKDEIEHGFGNVLPLWHFGLLY
ncbi:MAG: AAA family ATPase [Bacteroidota bacterium]